jgi:hypothetical protein
MAYNGKEVDKLLAIKEKVFNNIKLTKAEEFLLETTNEEAPAKTKSYTKALFNLPFGGQIYPLTENQFGTRFISSTPISWQAIVPTDLVAPVSINVPIDITTDINLMTDNELHKALKNTNLKEEKMSTEYSGLYQLIMYEETGDFTEEQIISARWLTKDMDAEQVERYFAVYAQGYEAANEKNNYDCGNSCLTLLYTPVGDVHAVCVDIRRYYL